MSMDSCYFCGWMIDTDDDPGCYHPVGPERVFNGTPEPEERAVCESCREQRGLEDD